MPPARTPASSAASVSTDAQARRLWTGIQEEILDILSEGGVAIRKREMSVNVPLAGVLTPAAGFIAGPIGVMFNCRVVGWQIAALTSGSVSVNIERSSTLTHPVLDSLPGVIGQYPAMNGFYSQSFDLSLWSATELADGDMLWFTVTAISGIQMAGLILRLQDLDEVVS